MISFHLFVAALGLCCCTRLSLIAVRGLLVVAALVASTDSSGWAQEPWHAVLVGLQHVGSSWTKD